MNSTLGKPSNIGFRAYQIFKEKPDDYSVEIICRSTIQKDSSIHVAFPMGSLLPRFINGLRILFFPKLPSRMIDNFLFFHLLKLFTFHKLKYKHYDLVHLWEFDLNMYQFFKTKSNHMVLDVPIPSTYESNRLSNQYPHYSSKQKINEKERALFDQIGNFIVPSVYVKSAITPIIDEKSHVFLNHFGVNIDSNFKLGNIPKKENKLKFLFVGNVNHRKGVDLLLKAWDNFGNKDNVELIVCGRISKELKKEISKYTFKNVYFKGHVNPKIYYESSDIFILPSLMEGSAKATYEALGYGLPVITTFNSGSIVEHLKEGLIIETGNIEAINDALNYCLQNIEKMNVMSKNAYLKAQQFPWSKYANNTYQIYNQLLEEEVH